MSVQIRPFEAGDRAAWEPLARGYKAFYRTEHDAETYERSWQRLLAGEAVFGLAALLDGQLVGIAHALIHTSVWSGPSCYLQDLFVAPAARGRGVARALIEALAQRARAAGASRYYWTTHRDNATARSLYDRLAEHRGMLRYDFPLDAG